MTGNFMVLAVFLIFNVAIYPSGNVDNGSVYRDRTLTGFDAGAGVAA